MHMILNAANNDGLATQAIDDPSEVTVHFSAQLTLPQKRPALFGRADNADENFGQRL